MRPKMLIVFVAVLCVLPAISRADSISTVVPNAFDVGAVEEYVSINGSGLAGAVSTSVVFSGPGGTVIEPVDDPSSTFLFVFVPYQVLNTAGSYSVTVRADDGGGVVRTIGPASITVNPGPAQLPLISAPETVTAEATSSTGAIVTFSVTAIGFANDPPVVSCDQVSGTMFPMGATTVHCQATDSIGTTFATFPVEVSDTRPPVLTLPGDITSSSQIVTFTASATDAIDGSVAVVCSPASGSTFSVGITTVTCSAADAHANTARGTFRVNVVLGALPVLTLPASFTVPATRSDGAIVTYTTSTNDGSPVLCDPASGDLFPLGQTRVDCSASNLNGTSVGSFTVTVNDTVPPVLTLPADFTASAGNATQLDVTFTATAVDLVSGPVPVICNPASGATFPVGTTTVQCTAADQAANSVSGSFHVTVTSTAVPPTLTLPANFSVEATGPNGAVATYTATADQNATVVCSPISGSVFALGANTVICTATNVGGISSSGSFVITVVDTTPPTLSLPANITKDATGPSGATVTFTATASDLVDGSVPVTCTPASGSTFPLGTTTVQCSSTDAHTNTAHGSFTITVVRTPPVLTLPADIVAEATSASGAVVAYSASAHDNVDSSLPVTCSPPSGSLFPLGPTMVQCSATNSAGTTSGVFVIDVEDRTPPGVTLTATPATLWPPNHKMVQVTVAVDAHDLVDPSPTSHIVSVTSSEPVTGPGDSTSPDWEITGPLTLDLRAERLGGTDRIYTITVETTDHAGNSVTNTVQVRVPQSKRRAL